MHTRKYGLSVRISIYSYIHMYTDDYMAPDHPHPIDSPTLHEVIHPTFSIDSGLFVHHYQQKGYCRKCE